MATPGAAAAPAGTPSAQQLDAELDAQRWAAAAEAARQQDMAGTGAAGGGAATPATDRSWPAYVKVGAEPAPGNVALGSAGLGLSMPLNMRPNLPLSLPTVQQMREHCSAVLDGRAAQRTQENYGQPAPNRPNCQWRNTAAIATHSRPTTTRRGGPKKSHGGRRRKEDFPGAAQAYEGLYERLMAETTITKHMLQSCFSDKELRVVMGMNKILINDLNPETGKYKEKPKGAKVEVLFPYVQNRTLITPSALHASFARFQTQPRPRPQLSLSLPLPQDHRHFTAPLPGSAHQASAPPHIAQQHLSAKRPLPSHAGWPHALLQRPGPDSERSPPQFLHPPIKRQRGAEEAVPTPASPAPLQPPADGHAESADNPLLSVQTAFLFGCCHCERPSPLRGAVHWRAYSGPRRQRRKRLRGRKSPRSKDWSDTRLTRADGAVAAQAR